MRVVLFAFLLSVALAGQATHAFAQFGGGPPTVGVAKVQVRPITEASEFVGRIQSIDRVDLVARVTAFIEARQFDEGGDVQKGEVLYRLERGPFEADLAAKQATVAQNQALLRNATITLNRAQSLLNTPAGQRSVVDDAIAQIRDGTEKGAEVSRLVVDEAGVLRSETSKLLDSVERLKEISLGKERSLPPAA